VKEVEAAANEDKKESKLVKKAEKMEKQLKKQADKDDIKSNLVEEIQNLAAKKIKKL
jgi:hypothetical protein